MELLFLGCEGVAWRQSGDDQGDSPADFVPIGGLKSVGKAARPRELDDFQQ